MTRRGLNLNGSSAGLLVLAKAFRDDGAGYAAWKIVLNYALEQKDAQ